jgi:Family of unknown function (DUF6152)
VLEVEVVAGRPGPLQQFGSPKIFTELKLKKETQPMKKMLGVTLAALTAVAVPVLAHHSFAAQYDATKKISLKGAVTKVEWMNPHARFYIDVKDEAGKVINWELELGSPNGLMRRGWTRNTLKIGDSVEVDGSLAKDGSKLANAQSVKDATGKRLFAASSQETGN